MKKLIAVLLISTAGAANACEPELTAGIGVADGYEQYSVVVTDGSANFGPVSTYTKPIGVITASCHWGNVRLKAIHLSSMDTRKDAGINWLGVEVNLLGWSR